MKDQVKWLEWWLKEELEGCKRKQAHSTQDIIMLKELACLTREVQKVCRHMHEHAHEGVAMPMEATKDKNPY